MKSVVEGVKMVDVEVMQKRSARVSTAPKAQQLPHTPACVDIYSYVYIYIYIYMYIYIYIYIYIYVIMYI